MFGYDMSWAAFHVLEVMSSSKYLQKRVGYLGAVQSFRPDTEVLMLATNLLKKDIVSSDIPNMSLPIVTLPHIITPSLALSLLSDVLPRLSHSHAVVRKKAIVCLYRLALVYPETLRVAWPKIKDRLLDDQEDSSVTAAIINVVCELGWRRPHDFLPLAPRFFELLVDGGNNWMAIKIIKLFATLTPLEPRLIRKLLRPLTNIIQTTTAMSLLYECINGVIQGGILDGTGDIGERDEIAGLCVGKLRAMIVMDTDPNLKYVALLAFNRVAISHPALVSMEKDVILDCLDDPDISIRIQALELAVKMVSSETLESVVNRLIIQLRSSPIATQDLSVKSKAATEIKPSAGGDDSDPGRNDWKANAAPSLPNDYRNEVLSRILQICSRDNYSDVLDFEWYVNALVQLVKLIPPGETYDAKPGIASRIGEEIRNVAVRVKSARWHATRAAESLILVDNRASLFPTGSSVGVGVLGPCAWVVGEYASYLAFPDRTLTSLIDSSNISLPARILSLYLQAIPKLFLFLSLSHDTRQWDNARRSEISLLLARIVSFLEMLNTHPDLDVQERASEFLELLRLTTEAVHSQSAEVEEVPLFLSHAFPSLFSGLELNPVAANAQRKVPVPENLDLNEPFNPRLYMILNESSNLSLQLDSEKSFHDFYYQDVSLSTKSDGFMQDDIYQPISYQDASENLLKDPAGLERRRAERRERNQDDPFYIGAGNGSSETPFISQSEYDISGGNILDIDAIPVVDLAIEDINKLRTNLPPEGTPRKSGPRPARVEVATDETIGPEDPSLGGSSETNEINKAKRSLLQVDSSGLGSLSLEDKHQLVPDVTQDMLRKEAEDKEMAKAMREVERLRLEMQRASERIHAEGVPAEGALVKKKKKKKKSTTVEDQLPGAELPEKGDGTTTVTKKTKKKKKATPAPESHEG
ncbi:AP-3 complex subunit delta [Paecilomyces variotii No. 5]|uniref:AP-3 complex subunit delta n=1 Tax=Byssochlamys spectabilis (strain No. 5 / NBRC 109023) TaxID=1356009 RepID=V5FEV5_BYSSN|nr:AP-3 complex subunit delta [Paecilomyces variotii No. 5]